MISLHITDKTQTPKVNTLPEDPSFKSRTVPEKIAPEDSSPCLSDHKSDIEVSGLKNSKFETFRHKKNWKGKV